MEEKKDEIKKIKKQNIKKRHRRESAMAVIGIAVIICLFIYGFTQFNIIPKEEHSKEVVISTSISPYTISVEKNDTIKFTNNKSTAVTVSFETYSIEEKLQIEEGKSAYLRLSKYKNLPEKNYYSLDSEDFGQIIVK